MKHCWINKTESKEVIAVFLGWGADEKSLGRMSVASCDVVAFYDYKNLDTTIDFRRYDKVYVVAWSMGVYNAECFLRQDDIQAVSKTAIAGTCMPVDDQYGLLVDICQGTYDNWADAPRRKFSMRMCGGRQGFVDLLPLMSDRSVEDQKSELKAIMERDKSMRVGDARWNKAIVSSSDLIFLPDNQRRFWQGRADVVVEVDMPHFPFGVIADWSQLLG